MKYSYLLQTLVLAKRPAPILWLIALIMFLQYSACTNYNESSKADKVVTTKAQYSECVQNILALDDSLGRIRNHDSEKISLSETIDKYVEQSNKALNFENCPEEFGKAFKAHLQSWIEMKEITDHYPDKRGEMHDLFEILDTSAYADTFKLRLQSIWSSWEEVENAAAAVLIE